MNQAATGRVTFIMSIRFPRFSLRTALLVITLLALPCTYAGDTFRTYYRQQQALARIAESTKPFPMLVQNTDTIIAT